MIASGDFPENDARTLIKLSLIEDVGAGDYTSLWTISPNAHSKAVLIAKQEGVLCGMHTAALVFAEMGVSVKVQINFDDGQKVKKGAKIMELQGPTQALLTGERTLLNIIQQLCGTATITAKYAEILAAGGNTKVLDTRKTIPGWRRLQKYAVRCGGGSNHRMGLHDMILIKDNHIAYCDSPLQALQAALQRNHLKLPIAIEVENLHTLSMVLSPNTNRVLLDNMDDYQLEEAVKFVRKSNYPQTILEASGNMNLKRVRKLAGVGLDYISVGALTHSVSAMDISMRIAM